MGDSGVASPRWEWRSVWVEEVEDDDDELEVFSSTKATAAFASAGLEDASEWRCPPPTSLETEVRVNQLIVISSFIRSASSNSDDMACKSSLSFWAVTIRSYTIPLKMRMISHASPPRISASRRWSLYVIVPPSRTIRPNKRHPIANWLCHLTRYGSENATCVSAASSTSAAIDALTSAARNTIVHNTTRNFRTWIPSGSNRQYPYLITNWNSSSDFLFRLNNIVTPPM